MIENKLYSASRKLPFSKEEVFGLFCVRFGVILDIYGRFFGLLNC